MNEPEINRSRRRIWIWSAAGACLLLVVILGFVRSPRKTELSFETAKADRGRIVSKVTATGTLSPLVTVQVGSQVSGRIQNLYADFNSSVKKGEVIARIDPQLFDAALAQARANLTAAKGNLTRAKAQAADARLQYQRNEALLLQSLVAQADRDTAKATADAADAAVTAAEGAVEQAQAALNQAEINRAYTTIYSPTDGVVISRNVDVGQTVAASLQAPTLFTIAENLQKMQVDTNVAESDVGKLRPGMEAGFFVDAYPNERFRGVVRQIRNAPQTIQNVVTYDAVLDVENPDLKLKPGMTANVTFVTADVDKVLRVPNAALRFRPPPELTAGLAGASPAAGPGGQGGRGRGQGGRGQGQGFPGQGQGRRGEGAAGSGGSGADHSDMKTVWVLSGGKPRPVSIRPGITDGTLTEVAEGQLQEGDAVITSVTGGESEAPNSAGRANPFRRPF